LTETSKPGFLLAEVIAERLLTARTGRAFAAARVKPPSYVAKELGDPAKAKAWDRGVRGIEGYRQEYGATDKSSALGDQAKGASQRAARARAKQRMREAQRRLGRARERQRQLGSSRGIEWTLGRGIGL